MPLTPYIEHLLNTRFGWDSCTLWSHWQVLRLPPEVVLGILNLNVGGESRQKGSAFVGAGDERVVEGDGATDGDNVFVGDAVVPIGYLDGFKDGAGDLVVAPLGDVDGSDVGIDDGIEDGMKDGSIDGTDDGAGDCVFAPLGTPDGNSDGAGDSVGSNDGFDDGIEDGKEDGFNDGTDDGAGDCVPVPKDGAEDGD